MTSPVDRLSDRAVYKQIADAIREGITTGHYQPGDQIPSEYALMDAFGVSRITARSAVHVLVSEGLVEPRHGAGTYVKLNAAQAAAAVVKEWSERLDRFCLDLKRQGFRVERDGNSVRVRLPAQVMVAGGDDL